MSKMVGYIQIEQVFMLSALLLIHHPILAANNDKHSTIESQSLTTVATPPSPAPPPSSTLPIPPTSSSGPDQSQTIVPTSTNTGPLTTTKESLSTSNSNGESSESYHGQPPVTELTGDHSTESSGSSSNPTDMNSNMTSSQPVLTECQDKNYCFNGGKCVITERGLPKCICPEEFYGARCQTRNICKTIIVDSLTGDQICARINRECIQNDRFFRCSCHDDEYFVFLTDQKKTDQQADFPKPSGKHTSLLNGQSLANDVSGDSSNFNYVFPESQAPSRNIPKHQTKGEMQQQGYIAECRKIDKCLGVRCKQMSEVCVDGRCVCNDNLGYIRDTSDDGICKLLNPCLVPTSDGSNICGQAKCVATYDQELYRCICPIGFKAIKVGQSRNSTQCALLTDDICAIPLLNKCQHLCHVDRIANNYICSCLPGYRAGIQVGVDDHLCFFEESYDRNDFLEQVRDSDDYSDYEFVVFPRDSDHSSNENRHHLSNTNYYHQSKRQDSDNQSSSRDSKGDTKVPVKKQIKRQRIHKWNQINSGRHTDDNHFGKFDLSNMSPQERCNMYCEENKICVLENGSTDSYRCVCDRQGYVSVGDRCLDWCSAAEFSYRVRGLLETVCYSGVCKPNNRPTQSNQASESELKSSWRPTYECDCSSSPLLYQDKETKLCKLDFQAILRPCLPGNEGYIDCVEHKNAYCAVLYRHSRIFARDLLKERPPDTLDNLASGMKTTPEDLLGSGANKAKAKPIDKLYTCVCSPEKKFLVDKPRNKARCVDECDLLNNECGRFNRMCRAATISPDDFGRRNLVRIDPDGPRMNFKRTGCECLPGFNVGPSESVDFTLDDNNPDDFGNPFKADGHLSILDTVNHNEIVVDHEQFRAKYININSRCLLDYDVVELHASLKAPSNFDPKWIPIRSKATIKPDEMPIKNSGNDQKHESQDTSTSPIEDDNRTGGRAGIDHNQYVLKIPHYMRVDISDFHRHVVFVAQCDPWLAPLSVEAYQECVEYRYWVFRKLRDHFADWRRIMNDHLKATFDMMEGNIRLRVNKCEATIKNIITSSPSRSNVATTDGKTIQFDPLDQNAIIDADIDCEITLHSANDELWPRNSRKVLLEKQLPKFIFAQPEDQFGSQYYLMAPNILISRDTFDHLSDHRKLFSPCESDYAYCDKQTKCEMVDIVNFTCTCEYGYTPIGSRDLYYADSRKEVCEDINECLFDVCKELENVSTCINEIGDYRCQCNRHYTGDNKRYCTHVCNTIPCKHGKCRLVDDHHAFCECEEGYKEADCSVQDPNVALRKANMIICGSIFASILLLAITMAISLNSQLKKTKKKLKQLEVASDAAHLFDLGHQRPFGPRMSKTSSNS